MKHLTISAFLLSTLSLFTLCSPHASAQEPTAPVPQAKIALESIEWLEYRAFGADRTDLPRVLLIGDSISGQYFEGVVKELKGKAYITRLGTSKAIALPAFFDEIKLALSQHKYSVIHFNNGLHGWGYTESEYGEGLAKWVQVLKTSAPGAKLIWASSTQVRTGSPRFDGFAPNNDRVKARNKIAASLMAQQNIPIDDLYALMEPHHDLLSDGVHYKSEGSALLIPQVAQCILKALGAKAGQADTTACSQPH